MKSTETYWPRQSRSERCRESCMVLVYEDGSITRLLTIKETDSEYEIERPSRQMNTHHSNTALRLKKGADWEREKGRLTWIMRLMRQGSIHERHIQAEREIALNWWGIEGSREIQLANYHFWWEDSSICRPGQLWSNKPALNSHHWW